MGGIACRFLFLLAVLVGQLGVGVVGEGGGRTPLSVREYVRPEEFNELKTLVKGLKSTRNKFETAFEAAAFSAILGSSAAKQSVCDSLKARLTRGVAAEELRVVLDEHVRADCGVPLLSKVLVRDLATLTTNFSNPRGGFFALAVLLKAVEVGGNKPTKEKVSEEWRTEVMTSLEAAVKKLKSSDPSTFWFYSSLLLLDPEATVTRHRLQMEVALESMLSSSQMPSNISITQRRTRSPLWLYGTLDVVEAVEKWQFEKWFKRPEPREVSVTIEGLVNEARRASKMTGSQFSVESRSIARLLVYLAHLERQTRAIGVVVTENTRKSEVDMEVLSCSLLTGRSLDDDVAKPLAVKVGEEGYKLELMTSDSTAKCSARPYGASIPLDAAKGVMSVGLVLEDGTVAKVPIYFKVSQPSMRFARLRAEASRKSVDGTRALGVSADETLELRGPKLDASAQFSVSHGSRVSFTVQLEEDLQDKSSSLPLPIYPEHVGLLLKLENGSRGPRGVSRSRFLVLSMEASGVFSGLLDLGDIGAPHATLLVAGRYRMSLVVGAGAQKTTTTTLLATLVSSGGDDTSVVEVPSANGTTELVASRLAPWSSRPIISHEFAPPTPKPFFAIPAVFLLLTTIVPMGGFVWGLGQVGVNIDLFPKSGLKQLLHLVFASTLLGVGFLLVFYWMELNLIQLLKVSVPIVLFTVAIGHRVLCDVRTFRAIGASPKAEKKDL